MIALLVPTRGRPNNIRRLAESVLRTVSDPSRIIMIWAVDEDDRESADVVIDELNGCQHHLVIGPREIPCKRWNQAWRSAKAWYSGNERPEIFGLLGDDIVMQTPNWDELVRASFALIPDRIAMVYGRDGFRDQAHASHPFLSYEWCEVLGSATPEYFSQDMSDVWLFEIAKAVGRAVYRPDLFTQHLHPDNPELRVELDATYQHNRMRRDRDRVGELYEQLTATRQQDVEKLRAAISV